MAELSSTHLRILVDVSSEHVDDVLDAVAERSFAHDVYFSLLGDTARITEKLTQVPYEAEFVQTIHCDNPTDAMTHMADAIASEKEKIAVATSQRSGTLASELCARPAALLDGLTRPALSTIVPAVKGPVHGERDRYFTLLDVEGTPADPITSAAILFSLGLPIAQWFTTDAPVRIGVLTLGEGSGISDAQRMLHAQLPSLSGRVEIVGLLGPAALLLGEADLVLSVGEGGAMFVHTLEATFVAAEALVQRETQGVRGRLGIRIFRSRLEKLKDYGNIDSYGGSLLLGAQSPCVLLRPEAGVRAWMNAFRILVKMNRTHVLTQQRNALAQIGASSV